MPCLRMLIAPHLDRPRRPPRSGDLATLYKRTSVWAALCHRVPQSAVDHCPVAILSRASLPLFRLWGAGAYRIPGLRLGLLPRAGAGRHDRPRQEFNRPGPEAIKIAVAHIRPWSRTCRDVKAMRERWARHRNHDLRHMGLVRPTPPSRPATASTSSSLRSRSRSSPGFRRLRRTPPALKTRIVGARPLHAQRLRPFFETPGFQSFIPARVRACLQQLRRSRPPPSRGARLAPLSFHELCSCAWPRFPTPLLEYLDWNDDLLISRCCPRRTAR